MRWTSLFFLLLSGLAPAQKLPPAHDLPALSERVGAVFAERCGACHGSQVASPKGKFGYSDDLDRVAAAFLDSGPLEQTKLWQRLVETVKPMPPKSSRNGPLTLDELSVVRWWIASRQTQPAAEPVAPAASNSDPVPGPDDTRSSTAIPARIGPLHPLVVHFPIALLFLAALLELPGLIRGRIGAAPGSPPCLVIAAGSALLAAGSGWIWADGAGTAGEVLEWHRWTGLGAAGVATAAALAFAWARRRPSRTSFLLARLLLFAATGLVAVAGHFGGLLVHGEDPLRALFAGS